MISEEEKRRIQALTSVDRNFYRKRMLRALLSEKIGVSRQELFELSGTSSEDRFEMHLEVMQDLGLVTDGSPYRITEFGERILEEIDRLHI